MAAKKTTTTSTARSNGASPVSSTAVRNTSIPPRTTASTGTQTKRPAPSHDQIARRAYEIWQSGKGGSQMDNWLRAERELRGI